MRPKLPKLELPGIPNPNWSLSQNRGRQRLQDNYCNYFKSHYTPSIRGGPGHPFPTRLCTPMVLHRVLGLGFRVQGLGFKVHILFGDFGVLRAWVWGPFAQSSGRMSCGWSHCSSPTWKSCKSESVQLRAAFILSRGAQLPCPQVLGILLICCLSRSDGFVHRLQPTCQPNVSGQELPMKPELTV